MSVCMHNDVAGRPSGRTPSSAPTSSTASSPPGAVLAELEQSARSASPRTPVREAFAKLVHDGLARPSAGAGSSSPRWTSATSTSSTTCARALEVKARPPRRPGSRPRGLRAVRRPLRARRGPRRGRELDRYYAVTAEFDAAVDEAVANPWLVRALSDVRTHLVRIRRLARHDPPGSSPPRPSTSSSPRRWPPVTPTWPRTPSTSTCTAGRTSGNTEHPVPPPARRGERVKQHEVRVHRSDEVRSRGRTRLAARPARDGRDRRPRPGRRRRRGDGRQPDRGQRRSECGVPVATPGGRGAVAGAGPPAVARRFRGARRRHDGDHVAGVGGVGERRRRARTRLPRHVPRRRVLPPRDNIPALLAVAQHVGCDGEHSAAHRHGLRGPGRPREAISLHRHKIDHVAHLGPSVAAGLGTMLGLRTEVVHQAIGQALHTTTATRQSRKGAISTWKAHAPAFAGKVAIEAVDRAVRGQTSPAPIYEGEDGVIAWLLDGPDARYVVELPEPGSPAARSSTPTRRSTPRSTRRRPSSTSPVACTASTRNCGPAERREHRPAHVAPHPRGHRVRRERPAEVRPDREPGNPGPLGAVHLRRRAAGRRLAPRGLLRLHPRRPADTVALWRKVSTVEDPEWTERYHATDPNRKAFGARVEARLADGRTIVDEIAVADAHPLGRTRSRRSQYEAKLAPRGGCAGRRGGRPVHRLARRLPELSAEEVRDLQVVAPPELLETVPLPVGLF